MAKHIITHYRKEKARK